MRLSTRQHIDILMYTAIIGGREVRMKVVRLKLKEYMDHHGITQAKLARETNLAANTIKGYYHEGVMRPELRVIAKLCEYLECDICDIMVLEDEKE